MNRMDLIRLEIKPYSRSVYRLSLQRPFHQIAQLPGGDGIIAADIRRAACSGELMQPDDTAAAVFGQLHSIDRNVRGIAGDQGFAGPAV